MKKFRILAAALIAAVLLCGCSLPAYAYAGGESTEQPAAGETAHVEEPTAEKEPEATGGNAGAPTESNDSVGKGGATERADFGGFAAEGAQAEFGPTRMGLEPVNPLTLDGSGTVIDNATGEEGKEFFTITTADDSVFYLVIDRQKTGSNVYFLNAVTVDDLMPLADPGKEDTPASVVSPEPTPEPIPDTEPEPAPQPEQKSGGSMGMLLLALAVVVIGGGAGWYFKIYRPKQQRAADLEDDYSDTPEPGYEDAADFETYKDGSEEVE